MTIIKLILVVAFQSVGGWGGAVIDRKMTRRVLSDFLINIIIKTHISYWTPYKVVH